MKISVIVTCFEKGQFLDDCLNSVFNQSYSNWECIIVNDGSSDKTEEIALKWTLKDSRFKYFYQKNQGVSIARNLGLEKAIGNLIQFLDCDDFINSIKFEKSLNKLSKDSNQIIITNFDRFDDYNKKHIEPHCILKEEYFNLKNILVYWDIKFSIPIHAAIFPIEIFKKLKFREDLKAKEDWFFWIELYNQNPKTCFINEPLVSYRMNPTSMTNNLKFMSQNKIETIKKIKEIINESQLLNLFYEEHILLTMNDNIELLERVDLLNYKRTWRYKLNKFLKLFKKQV